MDDFKFIVFGHHRIHALVYWLLFLLYSCPELLYTHISPELYLELKRNRSKIAATVSILRGSSILAADWKLGILFQVRQPVPSAQPYL